MKINNENNNMNELLACNKKAISGITLIALVVTIVVLLILAGITIATLFGNSGIINSTNEAKFKTEVSEIKTNLGTKNLGDFASNYTGGDSKSSVNGTIVNILGDSEINRAYNDRLIINNAELVYVGNSKLEEKWCADLQIKSIKTNGTEDKIALTINSDLSKAIEQKQVTKYQYPYQITGTLKSDIETKLGRPIDYSKDRFYLVNNSEDGKTYIYNDSQKVVIEVKEKTQIKRGTWFWQGSSQLDQAIMNNSTVQNEFFEKLDYYKISEMYLMVNTNRLVGNTQIENFVQNAYNRNIKTYIVVGERDYVGKSSWDGSIYKIFDKLNEYNNSVDYSKRIAGVSYDAEVWANSEYDWWNNNQIRKEHIEYLQEARRYATSKNLEVNFTLPFWYVQCSYTDDSGKEFNLYDEATKILDETILMLYRDTADKINSLVTGTQANAKDTIINYAKNNGCILNIAIETGETSEGNQVTFYEEETQTLGYINTQLSALEGMYSSDANNFKFAIHHATNLVKFLGGIEVDTAIEIRTPQDLKNFLADKTGMQGKTIKLMNDLDMEQYETLPYGDDTTFRGTFDGNNHMIKNLRIVQGKGNTGLFPAIEQGSTVKNLILKDCTITSTAHNVGSISGTNWGTIINCGNINSSVTGKQCVGGITGRNYAVLKNSFNTGNVTSTAYYVGGIAGKADTSSETNPIIFNVYNTGTITEGGKDGSRGGVTSQNSGTIEKAYWMTGSCDVSIGYTSPGECIEISSDEMKSSNFKDTLNNNRNGDPTLKEWVQDSENSGYPYFK